MKKLITTFYLVLVLLAGFGSPVFAASSVSGNIIERYLGVTFGSTCSTEEVAGIFCVIGKTINLLLGLVGGVALLFFVVGGLQYMASGGDEKALSTAKATISYAILGLLITLGAILGMDTLLRFLGV